MNSKVRFREFKGSMEELRDFFFCGGTDVLTRVTRKRWKYYGNVTIKLGVRKKKSARARTITGEGEEGRMKRACKARPLVKKGLK